MVSGSLDSDEEAIEDDDDDKEEGSQKEESNSRKGERGPSPQISAFSTARPLRCTDDTTSTEFERRAIASLEQTSINPEMDMDYARDRTLHLASMMVRTTAEKLEETIIALDKSKKEIEQIVADINIHSLDLHARLADMRLAHSYISEQLHFFACGGNIDESQLPTSSMWHSMVEDLNAVYNSRYSQI